ncbi:MAG: hypothetical protein VX370_00060 [Bacteroidota bacterium]|nr:hypothetical protein [Bacteroidota bacterium]
MKKILLILLCVPLIFSSCKKDENNNNPDSPFEGFWSGTYGGDESGNWDGTVSANGNCAGEATTTDFGTVSLTGNVNNDGDFTAAIGSGNYGITFVGIIDSNYVSGSWTSGVGGSGYWEGQLQSIIKR